MAGIDTAEKPVRTVLVNAEITTDASVSEDIGELRLLAESAELEVVDCISCRRDVPNPALYIGTGKTEELKSLVAATEADLVIFNNALSPAQERNLNRQLGCRVIDRTALILEIFALRARTYEGRLQVDLAGLRYQATRLVRGWTHLERQKGGFGLRGGPGEKQIELDRREIGERIEKIENELAVVEKRREVSRGKRRRNGIPVLSFVGYTNAGKSTLFNAITGAGVYAANQLFATLDPTVRRLEVPPAGTCVFADTVGFIRHLPHSLVAAFKSTLRETIDAALLLHVVDCSDPRMGDNIDQVNAVLAEIGAESVRQLLVYNKCDLLEGCEPRIQMGEDGFPRAAWVSAKTGAGLDKLLGAIADCVGGDMLEFRVALPCSQAKLRAELHAAGFVAAETFGEGGEFILDLRMPEEDFRRLDSRYMSALSGNTQG